MSNPASIVRRSAARFGAAGAAAVLLVGIGGAAAGAAPAATHSAAARPTRSTGSSAASAALAALARTAAAQPAEPRTGRYDYVETKGWYWDETVRSDGKVTGRLDRDHRKQWIARNGAGRILETRAGRTDNEFFGPGKLSGAQKLPTDPAALQRVLARSHPAYGTYEWFTAVNDVWDVQVVTPALESALLRMLVGKPHMRDRGMVTDLQGRRGIAISSDTFHNGRMRTTLILDPATGGLLDFSQHPLTPAFRLTRSVAGSGVTAWISEGYTDSDHRRP